MTHIEACRETIINKWYTMTLYVKTPLLERYSQSTSSDQPRVAKYTLCDTISIIAFVCSIALFDLYYSKFCF